MPSRSFRVRQLREQTCTICRTTYEKRNSLKRHIHSKHVQHLKCSFCDKTFPADRNTLRSLYMLRTHNYPVPETYLSGPLNANLEFNLSEGSINVISDHVVPVPVSAPTYLSALFPVEEPDFSGIPSVRLPSSALLMDEQQASGPRLLIQKLGTSFPHYPSRLQQSSRRLWLLPLSVRPSACFPTWMSETGSILSCWRNSPLPLPLRIPPKLEVPHLVALLAWLRLSHFPRPLWLRSYPYHLQFLQAETEAAVASILPKVEIDSFTVPTFTTFLEDSEESPAVQAAEGTFLLEIPAAAFTAETLTTAVPPPLV